jgi:hypothetical protein
VSESRVFDMNIFALDQNPYKAAVFHCDKHIVKMVIETAQILSTVHRKCGYDGDELYRKTHANHPCTIWAGENVGNYEWTWQLFVALCDQYTLRYNKIHASSRLLEPLSWMPDELPDGELTPFAQAMPDDVKGKDGVAAYRAYYRKYKADIAVWRYSLEPYWWSEGVAA